MDLAAVAKPLLADDRWLRRPGEFAVLVADHDIKGRLAKPLIIEHGTRAMLFQSGKFKGEIGEGRYNMDGFFKKLVHLSSDLAASIVLCDAGDVTIDLERDDSVLIVSKPKKAKVFTAAGQPLGTTPLAVPAGEKRQLELRKDGYYTQEFEVDAESPSPFQVELDREPIVIVYSEPSGAKIVHRGVTLGITPYRQLVQNDMDIELQFDRYASRQITIAPDSPREVRVTLEQKPYITIRSKPDGAKLYRSGGIELLGTTPVEVLIERDTAFEIHKEGFDIKPFTLSSQSKRDVVVPLKETSGIIDKIVKIDSKPSGAKVYRPGGAEFIGETPLEQPVRGERTIELQLVGFKTKIVTVAPDSADNVVFALAKDESARNVTVSDPLLNTPSSF
jgi:hypothetical protein